MVARHNVQARRAGPKATPNEKGAPVNGAPVYR